jgi:ADP-ribosylglycohydrolase
MLKWLAVGDAYGACFEYAPPGAARPNDLAGYSPNPAYPAIGGGRYTDDTQQSVAIALALLDGPLDRESVAGSLVRCYRRDPRAGYSRRMQSLIASCADGADLLARIDPSGESSGACMRAAAVGLCGDFREVLRLAEVQARVTHATEGGVFSSQAAALMAHLLRYGACTRAELPEAVAAHVPGPWTEPWSGAVGSRGMDACRAAMHAVSSSDSLSEVLRTAVGFGGDVDTVAAIATAAASCAADIRLDLPAALLDGLEDGPYGRSYLDELDRRLDAFARSRGAPGRKAPDGAGALPPAPA